MGEGMFGFERCDTHPVLDGFIYIALVEEEVCGFERSVNGFFEMTRALKYLREFFHGRWILRCDLRHAGIDLERLIKISLLIERESQTVQSFGVIGHLLQGCAIRCGGLVPFLVPGS